MPHGRASFLGLALCTGIACTNSSDRVAPAEPSDPIVSKPVSEPRPTSAPTSIEPLALRCDGAAVADALAAQDRAALEALASGGEGPSTRLLARWEAARSFDADGTIDPEAVDAFADALTKELGAAPPAWWVEHLASGKLREGDDAGPLAYDPGGRKDGDRRGAWVPGPGATQVRPNLAAVLTTADGKLFFDLSMGRVELGPLPPEPHAIEIARARAGSTLYYASFSRGAGGARFPLRAIASDGTERWTAEVCGPDRQILGGLGHLTVQLVVLEPPPDPDRAGQMHPSSGPTGIAVYTAESHGVALEVFDPSTGERELAWSSDLWFARGAPSRDATSRDHEE